jgi:D-alanyl-D-alanine carboxypeptidase
VNGFDIKNATTLPLARLRRPAARIAGPALALLLTVTVAAVPAQAATTTAPAKAAATAGATWSQLMRRKLNLDAESARGPVLLSSLRATATTRTSDLAQAQKTQTAAATAQAHAVTANQNAHARFTAARTAAAAAKTAVTAAQQRRPRDNRRITRAQLALTAANATVQARAVTIKQTAAVFRAARAVNTTATKRVATATTAYRNAVKAISDTQLRITALPKLRSALAVQAAAISGQAVTQTRDSFTTAQTTKVYGITVNKVVAFPVQRMIDDAAKGGVQLSGGGFRTKKQQIALRTTNGCPDIWTAPASSCRVPTAIPGRSLHEIGLAIDMTSGNKSISSRKSAAFKWLAAHAGKYGFVNLPSEPWHWSITGS